MATLGGIEPFTTDTELTGQASLTVAEADTAIELGSGDVPVLATPRVVALVEQAAVAALAGKFPDDMTSVGASISIDHLAPSGIGATVTASAVVEATDGAALEFALQAVQADTVVAEGSPRSRPQGGCARRGWGRGGVGRWGRTRLSNRSTKLLRGETIVRGTLQPATLIRRWEGGDLCVM